MCIRDAARVFRPRLDVRGWRLESSRQPRMQRAVVYSRYISDIYSNFQLLSVDKMGEERFDWGI